MLTDAMERPMYRLDQQTITPEFAACAQAAREHLIRQADGGIRSW